MPAGAAARRLYFSSGAPGFGSLLGPRIPGDAVERAYGLPANATVLESGSPPGTLLRGRFDVEQVARRLAALGYARSVENGWTVLRRGPDAHGPLGAAVEATALRGDTVFLGGTADVAALLDGPAAASLPWVRRLGRAAGPDATAVALGPPPDGLDALARRAGASPEQLLEQAGGRVPLTRYAG